jgi:hypothetical protein
VAPAPPGDKGRTSTPALPTLAFTDLEASLEGMAAAAAPEKNFTKGLCDYSKEPLLNLCVSYAGGLW